MSTVKTDSNKDLSKSHLSRIFAMMSINGVGLGLISVFIPIYLLKLGYSFEQVMLWMIIHHTTLLLISFLTVYCSNCIGLVHCLHIRFVLLISYILLLVYLPTNPQLFLLIPFIIGAEGAFYWIPLNILFVRNTEKETMGGSLSKFFTYPQIFSMWSPLIGAFLITQFSFQFVYWVALILVFIAFMPLLPLRSQKTHFTFTWHSARDIWVRNKKFFIPEVVDNYMEDAGVLLTLFIYINLLSVTQIGIIGTLTSAAVIIFTLIVGRINDKWNQFKLLRLGAIFVTVAWVLNAAIGSFFPNQWLFYVASIVTTLGTKTFLIPYQAMLFNAARKDDAQFIVLREIPTILGRVLLYSSAILLNKNQPLLFLIVGLVFVYFWFLNSRKLATSKV